MNEDLTSNESQLNGNGADMEQLSEETSSTDQTQGESSLSESDEATECSNTEAIAEIEQPLNLEELQTELELAQAEAEEYLDGWQRARAEFANYKKRVERERSELSEYIAAEVHSCYLTVLDDIERALEDRPEGEAEEWAQGIELIHRKLMTILGTAGIETIPAEGEMFDPTLHEALSYEVSEDHNEGQVIGVVQQGYRMGDRVLRPALVRVAKQES